MRSSFRHVCAGRGARAFPTAPLTAPSTPSVEHKQHVDKLTEQELRPQFVEELHALISLVYKNAKPKRLYNNNLNGSSTRSRSRKGEKGALPHPPT